MNSPLMHENKKLYGVLLCGALCCALSCAQSTEMEEARIAAAATGMYPSMSLAVEPSAAMIVGLQVCIPHPHARSKQPVMDEDVPSVISVCGCCCVAPFPQKETGCSRIL